MVLHLCLFDSLLHKLIDGSDARKLFGLLRVWLCRSLVWGCDEPDSLSDQFVSVGRLTRIAFISRWVHQVGSSPQWV